MQQASVELVSPRAVKKQLMDYIQAQFEGGADLPGVNITRIARPTDNMVTLTVQVSDAMPRQFELTIKAPW